MYWISKQKQTNITANSQALSRGVQVKTGNADYGEGLELVGLVNVSSLHSTVQWSLEKDPVCLKTK